MEKDLFLDVLESTATKREAKAYLSRFGSQKTGGHTSKPATLKHKDVGVNLGSLYLPVRAVEEDPVFSTTTKQSHFTRDIVQSLHVALVKIRAPQSIDELTLRGVGHTLSQLTQLGLSCVVVLDAKEAEGRGHRNGPELIAEQARRVVEVIGAYGGQGARQVDGVIGVFPVDPQEVSSVKIRSAIQVTHHELVLAPLRRGVVPVIAPIGFHSDTQRLVPVNADEVILALTREFAGLQAKMKAKNYIDEAAESNAVPQRQISLDRIIILDALGGILSIDRAHGSHVFINLEQEHDSIRKVLMSFKSDPLSRPIARKGSSDSLKLSNPSRKTAANESTAVQSNVLRETGADLQYSSIDIHIQNLELVKNALALLPPASSAFLTTPDAVANSESRPPLASQGPRVRTRRQRNPLIHNLLTDKPVFSSSLPSNRLRNSTLPASLPATPTSSATFFKRGMPVSIIPDPLVEAWTAPSILKPSIDMFDPRIDLSRLVHLIDDSFNRRLDVPHYLNRIKGRIAGVIIAGEYEGGAILTWETPPGVSAKNRGQMVPYLDKFAVLKRSQGAGGVADIVFKAMVRDCFPNGMCWRSRKNNPVNKWYFERAKGTWKIPGTNWTMFWTTEGVEIGDEVFSDYETVCRTVEPSWADKQNVVD